MALRRSQPAWSAAPIPQAVYRLLARLIRRPGANDPDHEYVADIAVDRHHHDRRYARAGLIEYLDFGVR
jgi:hypothetical protein